MEGGETKEVPQGETKGNRDNRRRTAMNNAINAGRTLGLATSRVATPHRNAPTSLGPWEHVTGLGTKMRKKKSKGGPERPAVPALPAAIRAAQHHLSRGNVAATGQRWTPLHERITRRQTRGPNPLLQQIHNVAPLRAAARDSVMARQRNNQDRLLALGKVTPMPHIDRLISGYMGVPDTTRMGLGETKDPNRSRYGGHRKKRRGRKTKRRRKKRRKKTRKKKRRKRRRTKRR